MSVWTQEDYAMLCRMIAKGVTSAEVNGEKVTFRSLDEMLRIKAQMEDQLGLNRSARQRYPTFRKG